MKFLRALIQSGIENLQGWRLHNLYEQPVPMCDWPLGRRVFIITTLNEHLLFQIMPISVWEPLDRYWRVAVRSPRSFSCSRLNRHTAGGAACSLPRPSGPFQQNCFPPCCHFLANHSQAIRKLQADKCIAQTLMGNLFNAVTALPDQ